MAAPTVRRHLFFAGVFAFALGGLAAGPSAVELRLFALLPGGHPSALWALFHGLALAAAALHFAGVRADRRRPPR